MKAREWCAQPFVANCWLHLEAEEGQKSVRQAGMFPSYEKGELTEGQKDPGRKRCD